jgi:hypothetical protein
LAGVVVCGGGFCNCLLSIERSAPIGLLTSGLTNVRSGPCEVFVQLEGFCLKLVLVSYLFRCSRSGATGGKTPQLDTL